MRISLLIFFVVFLLSSCQSNDSIILDLTSASNATSTPTPLPTPIPTPTLAPTPITTRTVSNDSDPIFLATTSGRRTLALCQQPDHNWCQNTECSSMTIRSVTPRPSAPPDPPSPITTDRMGTRKRAISRKFRAIASATPLSSDPSPG